MIAPILSAALLWASSWGPGGCATVVAPAIYSPPATQASQLLNTTIEIHCQPDDIIFVDGYRLQSIGPVRRVGWRLAPSQYEVTITRIRPDGERETRAVQFAAGTNTSVRFDQPAVGDDARNFGLDPSKLSQSEDKPISGTLTREHVERYIAATQSKLRVTIIVPESQVEQVKTGAKSLEDVAVVQVYPPGHWALERAGIKVENNQPTVVLQKPDGTLVAQARYDSIEQVRQLIERANTPSPSGPSLVERIPWWGWLIIAYIAYRALTNRKQGDGK
jgi:hypothetical protein